ncbi:uncharacterized protein DS421_17g578930 [Arachis hypogaea]|nr:uncharacterized protein DS421_17g578930 [Arachis hypogaea]
MSVAVELISERKRVAGEREKCCAAVPYCAATATPCRRQSCHRRVPPPLLTVEGKPCLRYCLPGQIHRLILPPPLACHFCSAVPLFAVLIVERKCFRSYSFSVPHFLVSFLSCCICGRYFCLPFFSASRGCLEYKS